MKKESPLRNRVKELRARLGIRQADLARDVGITRQTIIAIEKGRLNPSIVICLKVARLLREPVDYVFYLAPGWDTAEGIVAEEEAPVQSSTRVRVPSKAKRKAARTETGEVIPEGGAAATETVAATPTAAPDRYDRDRDTDADAVDETADEPVPASVTSPAKSEPADVPPKEKEKEEEDAEAAREKQGQAIWDFF